jgi:hypothetical protein
MLPLSMEFLMTTGANRDQILYCVISQVAPPLDVMDFKIFQPSAPLATPTISLQDFTAKLAISFRIKL